MTRFRLLLVSVVVLLLAAYALPAANADGERSASPVVIPNTSVSGVPKVLSSTWTHEGAPLVGHTVELQVKESGQSDFVTEGSAVTDGAGVARVSATITYNAQMRWHHLANGPVSESFSAVWTQGARVRVGAVLNDRTLRIGQRLVVTGRVLPAKPGRIARLVKVDADQSMTTIASARIGADGRYRIVRSFAKKAAYTIAVVAPPTFQNLGNSSTFRSIRVGSFPAARIIPARNADGYVGSTPLSGPTDFSSALTSEGEPLPGVPVTLRATAYDGAVTERHGVTDANGEVTVRIPVLVRSRIQWFYAGSGDLGPSRSEPFVWRVRPRVFLTLNDNTLVTGQRLVARGRTYPVRAGHVVRLWSGSAPRSAPSTVPYREPVLLARGVVGADGRFRLVRTFAKPGGRILFVTVSAGNGTLQGWSAERVIRVRAR